MNKIRLGDFIINFDEVLWIKKVGAGARVKFKGALVLDKNLIREDLLEISNVSEDDWFDLVNGEESK